MSAYVAVLRKDLLVELRTMESIPAMAIFSITTFVVFHFGLDAQSVEGDLAAGVLWVTLLFAAVLGINRLFVAEREQGGFDGFLLSPAEPAALLAAKASVLWIYLAIVEIVALPAFTLLLLGPSPWDGLPGLVLLLALANLGIAVTGALVSAIAIHTRARDLMVPLLGLPLLVPVVIAGAEGSGPLLERAAEGLAWRWAGTLALYDVVFALLAYAVFDHLLED